MTNIQSNCRMNPNFCTSCFRVNLFLSVFAALAMGTVIEMVHNDTNFHPPVAMPLIGGHTIARGRWPWLVSLQSKVVVSRIFGIFPVYRYYWCGGSLISDQWVMSAAHCFFGENSKAIPAKSWTARMATTSLKPNIREKVLHIFGKIFRKMKWRQWNVKIAKVIVYPDFQINDFHDDIALLKLSHPVPTEIISTIQPVPLAPKSAVLFPEAGSMCMMKGWGCTEGGGSVTKQARELSLPIMSNSECSHYFGVVSEEKICAGFTNHAKGICRGDSGGPLVCPSSHGWVQVGVASFTSKDHPEDYPGVFTRVAKYKDWIDQSMRLYS